MKTPCNVLRRHGGRQRQKTMILASYVRIEVTNN